MSDLEHILGELLPYKRQRINGDTEAVYNNMGTFSEVNDGNPIPNITGVVQVQLWYRLGGKNQIPGMYYGGMNPFTVPAVILGVEVNSMFQHEKMDSEIISNPMTGDVSLHKTVTEDLQAKIVSDKYIKLSSLLDNKGGETV